MIDFAQRRLMMVDTQVRPSDVTKFPIIDALLDTPREAFVPEGLREAAYVGENLDLGGGRTLLEPRTFAKMLDVLAIEPTDVILDVACGLGYSTAIAAKLGEFVVGVESDEARAAEAQTILSEHGVDNAAIIAAALDDGAAKSGPYDVIMIQGAVETVSTALIDQLKNGGRIAAIFAENALGVVRIGLKQDGEVTWRFAFNATAPLLPEFDVADEFQL